MRGILFAILSAVGLALALLWLAQRRMIYFPFDSVPPAVSLGLPRAEDVTFTTDDGVTHHGWFVPADSTPARFTVIVFNGNAGHRGMRAPVAAAVARHGVATLLFDYRGYGDNAGSASEDGLARDARAARQYLTTRTDIDTSRVVYFGESLGAAMALRLATESPPFALVLRSPFTSMTDIGRHHYPFSQCAGCCAISIHRSARGKRDEPNPGDRGRSRQHHPGRAEQAAVRRDRSREAPGGHCGRGPQRRGNVCGAGAAAGGARVRGGTRT